MEKFFRPKRNYGVNAKGHRDRGFSPLFEERTEQSSKDKQREHVVFYYGKSIGGNQGESASVLFTSLGSMH